MANPTSTGNTAHRRARVPGERATQRAITATAGTIAILTFAFSFGNIWSLGLRLGVSPWIAPLIGPAVDLSVVGLLVALRYLALRGAEPGTLRGPRGLLILCGTATLGLNIAEPLTTTDYGRAAFDAVGPLLLIGWSEVGPGLLRRIHSTTPRAEIGTGAGPAGESAGVIGSADRGGPVIGDGGRVRQTGRFDDLLVKRAWIIDRQHREQHDRPASAETLRRELRIGARRARELNVLLRAVNSANDVPIH